MKNLSLNSVSKLSLICSPLPTIRSSKTSSPLRSFKPVKIVMVIMVVSRNMTARPLTKSQLTLKLIRSWWRSCLMKLKITPNLNRTHLVWKRRKTEFIRPDLAPPNSPTATTWTLPPNSQTHPKNINLNIQLKTKSKMGRQLRTTQQPLRRPKAIRTTMEARCRTRTVFRIIRVFTGRTSCKWRHCYRVKTLSMPKLNETLVQA